MKSLNSQNGFTLLEVIVVLAGLSVLIASATIYGQYNYLKLEESHFFTLLQQDILLAQSLAIERKQVTYVKFSSEQRKYTITTKFEAYKTVSFPQSVQYKNNSFFSTIEYTPAGTITSFGTAYFSTSDVDKKLTAFIGRGRVQID
ncbi:competence type IV pilus minor pilin ComGD [Chryseomicrobium sp. FSL W7-1435]|uniref:competence type IV pilus minor pilin ComGD n=1 Tax=Chryseomicrobium sp. FSL W7-1435 TaxID=2921704 RepID=UPI003159F5E3